MSPASTSPIAPPSPAAPEPAGVRRSPRAYEDEAYGWNLARVPATYRLGEEDIPHPARTCAIFVVHGMGHQMWTETAAGLRAGFEDALEAIEGWQRGATAGVPRGGDAHRIPPPFVYDGYWADYADLEATFPEDWTRFNDRERTFFSGLWQRRTMSLMRTVGWLLTQQVRILHPRVMRDVKVTQYLLYWPLQLLWLGGFVYCAVRHPKALTRVIADVRLYASPRGVAERAIVQRIDYRVGRRFLQLIGLDWNFRALPSADRVQASGTPYSFERVIWVAHSLGTVVSYNVLSDLFHRACEIERTGDSEQQLGVKVFRRSLLRFVTLGSPLNKFAYLFEHAVRPWPRVPRSTLLEHGDELTTDGQTSREWWINFYHVLDPVSAPLVHERITGGHDHAPFNFHIEWRQLTALVPGVAHIAYWSDISTLRFILGRLFGRRVLRDRQYVPKSPGVLKAYAVLGYAVWAAIICTGVWALFLVTPRLASRALQWIAAPF
jgi:hypothetical protein